MDHLFIYLPQHEGLLPKWLLLVSIVAMGNSIQAYSTLHYTKRVYSGSSSPSRASSSPSKAYPDSSPVNPLSARTFGTWSFMSAVIRLYAAYHITDPVVYQLALWTYAVAGWHFFSEWLVFGTAKWGAGLAGPVIVATVSSAWMLWSWEAYIGAQ